MTRLIQLALLLAIIIPFGMAVRWGVEGLSDYWLDMGVAALIGFAACYGLWQWNDRQRENSRRGD